MAGIRWLAGMLVLVPGLAEAQTLSGASEWTVAKGSNVSGGQKAVNNSFWQSYTVSFGSFVLDPRLIKYDASVSLRTNRISFGNAQDAHKGAQRTAGYHANAALFSARPFPLTVQLARNNITESGAFPTSSVIRGGVVVPPGQPLPDFQTVNNSLSINWQLKTTRLPHVDLGYRTSDSLTSGGGFGAEQRDGELHATVSKDTRATRQALRLQQTSFTHLIDQAFNQHFSELDYQFDALLDRRSRFTARAGRRRSLSLFDEPTQIVDAGTGIALPPAQGQSDTVYATSGVTFEPSGRVSLGFTGSMDDQRAASISTNSRLVTTTARVDPVAGLSLGASGNYGTRGQVVGGVPLTVLTRSAEAGIRYHAGVRGLEGSLAATRRIGENSAPDGRFIPVQSWSGDASLSASIAGVSVTGGYERRHSEDGILDFGNFDVRRRRAAVQMTGRRFSVMGDWDRSISDRGLSLTFLHVVQDTYSASFSFRRHDTAVAASVGGFDSRRAQGRDRTHFAGGSFESRLRKVQLSAVLREELTASSAASLDQRSLVGFIKAEYTRRQFGLAVEYRRSAQHLSFARVLRPDEYRGQQFMLRISRKFGARR